MAEVGLELHPEKTRIVCCQDANRRASYEHTEFTFLGFTFRARSAVRKDGGTFRSFLPAISGARFFAPWAWPPASGDQNDKSRMTRDRHVRTCEGRGVRLSSATRRETPVSGISGAGTGGSDTADLPHFPADRSIRKTIHLKAGAAHFG